MNILLINHYAGSPDMGMEFRPYYLAREWVKMGHHVRIAAGDYSHLRLKNPVVHRDFQREDIDGIDYYWLRTGDYKGNGLRRAFTMFRFVGKLWLKAGIIARKWKPDVVIASSTYPLDTYAAQRIARMSGARLIHEVHDMWPITLIELGGMTRRHPFVFLTQKAENSFCRHSDYVVSLLPKAKDYFIRHGMKDEKFRAISNGIVTEEWENAEPLPENHRATFDQLKQSGKFIICYFGSHTNAYALSFLIKAVQKLKNDKISVVFVGSGNQKTELETLSQKGKGTNFVFLPPVPKHSVPELLKLADALYVGALRNDMFRFGICMNKLYDSMMAGKPIIYAVEAPNNYISEFNCGISVAAENVEALKEGILELYQLPEEDRMQMGRNGRKSVMQHFTYKKLAEEFAALFEENLK